MDQTIRMNGKWIHGSDTFDARSKQESALHRMQEHDTRVTAPHALCGNVPNNSGATAFARLPSRRFKRHSQREEKEAAGTAPDSEPNTEQQRHATICTTKHQGYSGRTAGASSLSPFGLLSTR